MWTCWRSADFKTQIKENSAAHVAVAKIVKELDDRKIKLRKAFKLLDRDKDGTISVEDLPKVRININRFCCQSNRASYLCCRRC